VRAARCNLHCRWCDSDHTWNFTGTPWPHDKDQLPGYAKHLPAQVVIEAAPADLAARTLALDCPRLVLTGGEPLLQQAGWVEMLRLVRASRPDTMVEVETNGTLIPEPDLEQVVDQFNVSPKLANAGMPETMRLVPAALAWFAASPKTWFKFVVAQPDDLAEIENLLGRFGLPRCRTILMPEGRDSATLDRRSAWLAGLCRDRGLRLGDRLQIRLWGDRPGT
jgi:organic radical activating enzyme